MSPVVLTCVAGLTNGTMSILPWGGPTVRAGAALELEPSEVYVPMIPPLIVVVVVVLILDLSLWPSCSWWVPPSPWRSTFPGSGTMKWSPTPVPSSQCPAWCSRPRLWSVPSRAPGMVDAMAEWVTAVIPDSLGGYPAPVTGILSMPFTFFMSNDASYSGILPVRSERAAHSGIAPAAMARADVNVSDYTTGTLVSWDLEGPGVNCCINTHARSSSMACTLDFSEDVRDHGNGEAAVALAVSFVRDGQEFSDGDSRDRNMKVACHKGQLGIKVPHTTPGVPA